MSTETVTLLELKVIRYELACLRAEIAAKSTTPWPDRLSTTEAVLYVRHAHRNPKFTASTLYRWLRDGRGLSDIARPRRWLRDEIDRQLGGVVRADETRGARRQEVGVSAGAPAPGAGGGASPAGPAQTSPPGSSILPANPGPQGFPAGDAPGGAAPTLHSHPDPSSTQLTVAAPGSGGRSSSERS